MSLSLLLAWGETHQNMNAVQSTSDSVSATCQQGTRHETNGFDIKRKKEKINKNLSYRFFLQVRQLAHTSHVRGPETSQGDNIYTHTHINSRQIISQRLNTNKVGVSFIVLWSKLSLL